MPDDVVEDPSRREQQPPVEAHRAGGRAGAPARALVADRQARVGPPEPRGAASSRGATSARASRRYQRSSAGPRVAAGHEQLVAAAVHPRAAGLGHEAQVARRGRAPAGSRATSRAALRLGAGVDPGAQLASAPRPPRSARAGAARLDATLGVDGDPDAAGARSSGGSCTGSGGHARHPARAPRIGGGGEPTCVALPAGVAPTLRRVPQRRAAAPRGRTRSVDHMLVFSHRTRAKDKISGLALGSSGRGGSAPTASTTRESTCGTKSGPGGRCSPRTCPSSRSPDATRYATHQGRQLRKAAMSPARVCTDRLVSSSVPSRPMVSRICARYSAQHGAVRDMGVEAAPVGVGKRSVEVGGDRLDQLVAGHLGHAMTAVASKAASRAARTLVRARWRSTRWWVSLRPSALQVSSELQPTMSRKVMTARWFSGSAATVWRIDCARLPQSRARCSGHGTGAIAQCPGQRGCSSRQEAIGADRRVVVAERRERAAARFAHAPRPGDVDDDSEDPRRQPRATFEALQVAEHDDPGFLHRLFGDRRAGVDARQLEHARAERRRRARRRRAPRRLAARRPEQRRWSSMCASGMV